MTFQWKQDNPLSFPKDFGEGFFRLPKYIVTFRTRDEPYIINYGDGKLLGVTESDMRDNKLMTI